jgi:hypothetical protein
MAILRLEHIFSLARSRCVRAVFLAVEDAYENRWRLYFVVNDLTPLIKVSLLLLTFSPDMLTEFILCY